ncbi:NAD(P)H-hydrate dehydratase [Rhodophyticola sp. CCM32]|uniref:NAD(P)H-hydrate dehydratase n=1 Tax=Rhodophyticola sp. CCM32 TaxID=2916397 RepID=UPI003083207B
MAEALRKSPEAHKYSHGHAMILSGPMGRSGAARLAARGALRIGAGLVTVAAPGSAMMECATQLTAIMLRKSDGAEGLAALLDDTRINAICLGPGIGVGERTQALVRAALGQGVSPSYPARSVVLDADALTSFENDPQTLFALLHARVVLTPHAGEFARLFPDIAAKTAAAPETGPGSSRDEACREAAARAGCVVLLKGADTVIAAPDGRCAVNSGTAPWLATAGSGDVLAGMICGLLARGFAPMEAAETGAWLHMRCASMFGPGLIAEDLPEMLPKVLRLLETGNLPQTG